MLTVDEIIAQQKVFTPEQRSLAYMPEPPKERFAADCRPGGNCGLDFSNDSLHARWLRARFRLHQEQKAIAIERLRQTMREEAVLEAERHLREERLACMELRRKLSDSVYVEVLRKEGRL